MAEALQEEVTATTNPRQREPPTSAQSYGCPGGTYPARASGGEQVETWNKHVSKGSQPLRGAHPSLELGRYR